MVTILVTLLCGALTGRAEGQSKCEAMKLKAAAKKALALGKCHAAGVAAGIPAEAKCVAKAEAKFTAGFSKAEANGPCLTTGNRDAIETKIDNYVASLVDTVAPDGASGDCPSRKLKAAAKEAAGKTKCFAKAALKGTAVDPACLSKQEVKSASGFAKAEDKGDCATISDAQLVTERADAFVQDLVVELLFPALGFPGAWVEQGPGPAIVPSYAGFSQTSGAVQAIAPDPTDPDRVFIGTVNGGVWLTENATAATPTWVPLTDDAPSLSITSISLSPLDATHDTVYAGMGSTLSHAFPINGDNYGPLRGILKSTDGGSSWTELGRSTFANQRISRVLPTANAAAGGGQVFVATIAFPYDSPGGGVYRSADGGQTWDKRSGSGGVDANGLPDASFVDIAQDPGNPQRFYAATDNPPRVFRSEDGGDTWTDLSATIGLPTLVYAPTRLALSPSADGMGRHWIYVLSLGPGLFLSSDNGVSWRHLDDPPDSSRFAEVIAVSPSDPAIVFAGSDSGAHWRGSVGPVTTSWYQVNFANAGGTAAHTDARDWVFTADQNVMLHADDGGIYRLRSPFAPNPVWDSAIGNLRVTEFLSIAYDSVNDIVFGACWDNSIPQQTAPDGIMWGMNEDFWGDGVQAAADNASVAGASVHYSSQQNLFRARRRTYIGPTNVTLDVPLALIINGAGGRTYNQVEGALGGFGTIRFNQSWALNAMDGARLVFGTDYLYESFDRGDHFNSLGGIGLNGTGDPIPLNPVGTVTAYAYGHANNPDLLYIGTAGNVGNQRLWVRSAGTGAPTASVSYPGAIPWDIALDPTDASVAYVLDSSGRVWRTNDGGASVGGWTEVTGYLSSLSADLRSIETVAASPAGPIAVFVGGYGGVFVNTDPGGSSSIGWRRLGATFPNVIVTDVHYDGSDDLMIAGTLGRGAWKLSNASAFAFPPVVP